MDDFLLSDQTVNEMNAEYERTLPVHLKAFAGKQPFSLNKGELTDINSRIREGLNVLFSFCTHYADSHTFCDISELIKQTAIKIHDEYLARFKREPERVACDLAPCRAFMTACDVYLVLPTPENAVIMTSIALTVK